jgi:hypothetical protein
MSNLGLVIVAAAALSLGAAPSSSTTATGFVSGRSHGCVGDGAADDTACVRACLGAAGRPRLAAQDWGEGAGGVCFLPRGIYRITDTVHWETDGTVLAGEGANATAILLDLGSGSKDGLTLGNAATGGGRRSGIRDLAIYAARPGTCRDGVSIDGAAWWRLENLHIHQAGRHGLTIRGTLGGAAIDVRSSYNGGSGLFIQPDSAGTGHTSTDLYHFYAQANQKHGVLIERAHVVNFFGPIIEFNGAGGDAASGDGVRLGTTVDATIEVNLFGAYFESNRGWDINAGTAAAGGQFHLVNAYGYFGEANTPPAKAAGFGFFTGTRARGTFSGGRLSGYTAGASHKTYSLDATCQVSILSEHGDIADSNAPEYRGGASINEYGGGLVQWRNEDGQSVLYGRYLLRAGGLGSAPSVALGRSATTPPSSGTWAVGDHVVNTAPGNGGPQGWTCTAAGSPGTWAPSGFVPSVVSYSDASPTLADPPSVIRFTGTLSAARTLALKPLVAGHAGRKVQVVRAAGNRGGTWPLSVNGLKELAAGAWCEVVWDGAAWVLVAGGTL